MKRIGVLTSSRSDYGILLPLLQGMQDDADIELKLIVFGTHLSYTHGYTINQIEGDGFRVKFKVYSLVMGDTQESVASAIGLTQIKFASFWAEHKHEFDMVVCIGDRYEMFGAVSAGIPFNMVFAHIHAGEITLGAIDNIFRHAISHASTIHFTSTEFYAERVRAMIDSPIEVHNVGALSLDSLAKMKLFTVSEFLEKWKIDLTKRPSVLITFHPETLSIGNNEAYANILAEVVLDLTRQYQAIITMPNADSEGDMIRTVLTGKLSGHEHVSLVENFGTKGYFTAMKYARFLVGNTSSGIIEAASFNKYVINIGNRQNGRICSTNVMNVPIDYKAILGAIEKVEALGNFTGENLYWNGGASALIKNVLKKYN